MSTSNGHRWRVLSAAWRVAVCAGGDRKPSQPWTSSALEEETEPVALRKLGVLLPLLATGLSVLYGLIFCGASGWRGWEGPWIAELRYVQDESRPERKSVGG